MKTKLEMAHEFYLANKDNYIGTSFSNIAMQCFGYADAMQAEADKRKASGVPEAILNPSNSRELEWQPDWSQAPDGYEWWAMDKDGDSYFFTYEPYFTDDSDYFADHHTTYRTGRAEHVKGAFNYQGDWKDSLRKRHKK